MESLSEKNWLIVGLGNPGTQYERTRHNLGFMLVDRLAREAQTQIKREECRSLVGRAEIENRRAELVKPQTFMNLSGEAVKCLLKKPERTADKLIVVSDDLALPVGAMRLRGKGSHGGQNGLRSIIDCLGTNEFIRLRIGIQPEHSIRNTSNFVLEKFSKTETEKIEQVLETCAEAIRTVIADGVEKAMAKYN
ncbi:MAG TPA: aminoacyl-tRNA hydrolase [Pyrinomonadaceae bacterium]|jgi:PTH1 family peptidyl-tRNA hydrolase